MSKYEIRRRGRSGKEEAVDVNEHVYDWLCSADPYQGRLEQYDDELHNLRRFLAELTETLLSHGALRPEDIENLCYGCTIRLRSVVR
jgi:hypothetical protein